MKKHNILKDFSDNSKLKIFNWVEQMSGTATKRLDYIKINLLNSNPNDINIECGTGLRSQNMFYHNPLKRILRNTLNGDNNTELESEAEIKDISQLEKSSDIKV
jgi:hypothetical protein